MTELRPEASAVDIAALLVAMRPKLHRYCARMVGSVIDGEDVLQDALIKAVEAHAVAGGIANPEGWLFRIAHNTALDFLRRRKRQEAHRDDAEVDMMPDQLDAVESRQIAGASLRTFMRLPVAQRSSVILMDVLGCSLHEVCEVMACSLPAAKAALHRGRTQLRDLRRGAGRRAATASVRCRSRAARRLCRAFQRARFRRDPRHDRGRCSARSRQQDPTERQGRSVPLLRQLRQASATGIWCRAWSRANPRSWCSILMTAILGPKYFVLLNWAGGKVATIRDFRHASYVIEGAEYSGLTSARIPGITQPADRCRSQNLRQSRLPDLNYNSCHPRHLRIMVQAVGV